MVDFTKNYSEKKNPPVEMILKITAGGVRDSFSKSEYAAPWRETFEKPGIVAVRSSTEEECVDAGAGDVGQEELVAGDPYTFFIIRESEVWTGKNSSSMTLGTFQFGDMTGYICEPHGEETRQRGKDKRIPSGEYNIKWHAGKSYSKNVYTKNGRHGKNHNLDFPELKNGVVCLYNDEVPQSRGILMHAGTDGNWTSGCILVSSSMDKNKKRRIFDLKQSVTTLYKILDIIEERGINKVKIVIKDEIN